MFAEIRYFLSAMEIHTHVFNININSSLEFLCSIRFIIMHNEFRQTPKFSKQVYRVKYILIKHQYEKGWSNPIFFKRKSWSANSN